MRNIEECTQELKKKGVKINEKNERGFYKTKEPYFMNGKWKLITKGVQTPFFIKGAVKNYVLQPPHAILFMYIFLGENICAPPMFYVIHVIYDVFSMSKTMWIKIKSGI